MNQEHSKRVSLAMKALDAALINGVNRANDVRQQPDTEPTERGRLTAFMNDAVTFNQRLLEYAGDLGLMEDGEWQEIEEHKDGK